MYFPKGEAIVVYPLSMVMRLSEKAVQCLLLLNADSLVLDDSQVEEFFD